VKRQTSNRVIRGLGDRSFSRKFYSADSFGGQCLVAKIYRMYGWDVRDFINSTFAVRTFLVRNVYSKRM
jgi:hypothetical protein